MVRFNIECTVAFPQREFWRIRDSPSFIRFIVEDGILKRMTTTEPVVEADGWLSRTQVYCPAHVDCPDFIRPLVGDTMFEVSDFQRWKEEVKPYNLSFVIRPTFLTSLSNTRGELSIEKFPGDNSTEADSKTPAYSTNANFKTTPVHHNSDNDNDNASADGSADSVRLTADGITSEVDSEDSNCQDLEPQKCCDKLSDDDVELPSRRAKCCSTRSRSADDLVSEIDSASVDSVNSTDRESDHADSCDDEDDAAVKTDPNAYIDRLPPSDKSIHRVVGHTRVRILTLGWFVERAIVHNLRQFYKSYPATVLRFRRKLYREFARGDSSVPVSVVVDRFLQHEAKIASQQTRDHASAEEQNVDSQSQHETVSSPSTPESEQAQNGNGDSRKSRPLSKNANTCANNPEALPVGG